MIYVIIVSWESNTSDEEEFIAKYIIIHKKKIIY